MKTIPVRILFVCLLGASLIFLSCNPNNPPQSFDDAIDWTTFTLVIQDSGASPVADLVVGAVAADTGRVFSSVTGNDGSVSLRVPQDSSYILSIISKDGKSFGSAVVLSDTEKGLSRTVPTPSTETVGIKSPDSATPLSLGTVEIPDDPKTTPFEVYAPDAARDTALLAKVDSNGVPLGNSSFGKPSSPSGTLPGGHYSGDPDMDGLPNIIDTDDDGDGIPDDWDKDSDGDLVTDSSVDLSDTLPVEFTIGYLLDIRGGEGVYSYFHGDINDALRRDMRADLMVKINDPARIDAVTSVALYSGSSTAYAASLTAAEFDTTDNVQHFVDGSSYNPGANVYSAPWNLLENSDSIAYQLPVSENDSDDDRLVCRVGLKIPETASDLYAVGDVFTVELQYSTSSGIATEYYSGMINYIYENITRFQGTAVRANGAGAPAATDFTSVWDGTPGDPYPGDEDNPIELTYTATTDDIWFKIIPPKDADGDYITTGGFRYEIFDATAAGPRYIGTWQPPSDGHCRYDSGDIELETYFDSETPPFYAVPIPVQYILDCDVNADDEIDIEYFMNINEDSYIKNRLRFSISTAD